MAGLIGVLCCHIENTILGFFVKETVLEPQCLYCIVELPNCMCISTYLTCS